MHEHETMGRIDTTGKVQHFARNSPILELYVINVSPSQVGAALEAQFHAKKPCCIITRGICSRNSVSQSANSGNSTQTPYVVEGS